MSLGAAGLVFGAGAGQTTVPVTPEEASADAAVLGTLFASGGTGAGVTGGGNGSASGGPVVFTGGSVRVRGRRGMEVGGLVIVMSLNILLMDLGFG